MTIARVDTEKHLIMIQGGVPGSKNGLVLIRQAVKTRGKGGPVQTGKKKGK
jgi:large subunit ribosomal protein L3